MIPTKRQDFCKCQDFCICRNPGASTQKCVGFCTRCGNPGTPPRFPQNARISANARISTWHQKKKNRHFSVRAVRKKKTINLEFVKTKIFTIRERHGFSNRLKVVDVAVQKMTRTMMTPCKRKKFGVLLAVEVNYASSRRVVGPSNFP